jgi:hypothetical protein
MCLDVTLAFWFFVKVRTRSSILTFSERHLTIRGLARGAFALL